MSPIRKWYYKMRYVWKGHIANPIWRERRRRRRIRKNEYEVMQHSLLSDYIPFAESLKAPAPSSLSDVKDEERVFCLWFQDEANTPEIVRKCIANLRRRFGERLVFLTEKNLSEYISFPDYIMDKWRKKRIIPANFSDLVRIELLAKYGGYWFDATVWVTGEIPDIVRESSFFMYVASERYFKRMFVQTCFMHAKPYDPLLMMWRELIFEYWRRENKAIDYFMVHYLLKFLVRHNEEAGALFEKMPKLEQDRTHDLWYRIGNEPYSEEKFREMIEAVFFQKLSYKKGSDAIERILPDTMADYVINDKVQN